MGKKGGWSGRRPETGKLPGTAPEDAEIESGVVEIERRLGVRRACEVTGTSYFISCVTVKHAKTCGKPFINHHSSVQERFGAQEHSVNLERVDRGAPHTAAVGITLSSSVSLVPKTLLTCRHAKRGKHLVTLGIPPFCASSSMGDFTQGHSNSTSNNSNMMEIPKAGAFHTLL